MSSGTGNYLRIADALDLPTPLTVCLGSEENALGAARGKGACDGLVSTVENTGSHRDDLSLEFHNAWPDIRV